MHNLESVLENETHKILWESEIQTDHLISIRRLDLVIDDNKKRTWRIVDFVVLADLWVKLENWKKSVEHESKGDTNHNRRAQYSHKRIDKGFRGFGNKRTSGNHPNDSIIKIDQNAEKSHGDLNWLAVTQTPVRNHQLRLVWKTIKRVK